MSMLLKSEKLQAPASFGHLLSSAKATIDTFSNIYVSRTCKLVNFVAHNLAKHARHVIGFSLLMGMFLHTSMMFFMLFCLIFH